MSLIYINLINDTLFTTTTRVSYSGLPKYRKIFHQQQLTKRRDEIWVPTEGVLV